MAIFSASSGLPTFSALRALLSPIQFKVSCLLRSHILSRHLHCSGNIISKGYFYRTRSVAIFFLWVSFQSHTKMVGHFLFTPYLDYTLNGIVMIKYRQVFNNRTKTYMTTIYINISTWRIVTMCIHANAQTVGSYFQF